MQVSTPARYTTLLICYSSFGLDRKCNFLFPHRIEPVPFKKLPSFSSYSSPLSIRSRQKCKSIVQSRWFVSRCRAIPKLVYSVQSTLKYGTCSSLELCFLFRLLHMVITRRGNYTEKSRRNILLTADKVPAFERDYIVRLFSDVMFMFVPLIPYLHRRACFSNLFFFFLFLLKNNDIFSNAILLKCDTHTPLFRNRLQFFLLWTAFI